MVSEKDRNGQLQDARALAATIVDEQGTDGDAKNTFMVQAVVEYPLISSGDLVAAWDDAVGLPRQPEPVQENTASSASHHPAE
jgi:hypothetical protein